MALYIVVIWAVLIGLQYANGNSAVAAAPEQPVVEASFKSTSTANAMDNLCAIPNTGLLCP